MFKMKHWNDDFARESSISARISHRNSVCLSVRPSVCHMGELVKNGAS